MIIISDDANVRAKPMVSNNKYHIESMVIMVSNDNGIIL